MKKACSNPFRTHTTGVEGGGEDSSDTATSQQMLRPQRSFRRVCLVILEQSGSTGRLVGRIMART